MRRHRRSPSSTRPPARRASPATPRRSWSTGPASATSWPTSTRGRISSRETRRGAPSIPSREARETIWAAWQRFLDYTLALDSLGRAHQGFDALPSPAREQSFAIGHAAFVAQYRFALELLARLDRNPDLQPLLDEPVPELGLPRGTYAHVRLRFLNVARATEFGALAVVDGSTRGAVPTALAAGLLEDRGALWRYGAGRGQLMTGTNALQMVQRAGFAAWFPVQAGIADWMGDTRLLPKDRALVSPAQVATLGAVLEPGDILLVRREGYLSNIGIPGFWPHAVLYVGTPDERQRTFAGPEVAAWVESRGQADGNFEALLARTYPAAYAQAIAVDGGAPRRALEAISEGVVFTTLEHAAGADHVAALRPRLSAVEKAAAILRAFGYAGRPYDFNFDFRTDAVLVCSELVYKAYEPGSGTPGAAPPAGRGPRPAGPAAERDRAAVRRGVRDAGAPSSTWCGSSTAGQTAAWPSRATRRRSVGAGSGRSGQCRRQAGQL